MNLITQIIKELPYMKGLRYDTFALYTQMYLETGNFTCKLTPYFNLTGMMPRPDCPYPSKKFWTKEYEEGKLVDKFSEFNLYPTPLDYFKDYNKMIQMKFLFSYKNRGDYIKYFTGLMNYNASGDIIYPSFCSAKGYEKKLIALYSKLNKSTHHELKQMI